MSPALKRILFLAALGMGGAVVFRTFFFETIYVASDSMAPALHKGDQVIVNKFAPYFRDPRRGEVVMFDSPVEPEKGMVKRVIAIGGDRYEIRRKEVFINDQPLAEPYAQHIRADEMLEGDNIGPYIVPRGTVFVMGDNRAVSGDSRDWRNGEGKRIPYLPVDAITGFVHF